MTFKLQMVLIIGIIVYFFLIFSLLKNGRLLLKYSLLWILTGVVMLVLAIYPSIMEKIVKFMGIYDAVNGLFTLVIFFVIVILMSVTSIVSKLRSQNKNLVQQVALLEKRVRDLERSVIS